MIQKNNEIQSLYQNYFLDYASYVIIERAIPALEDGLKPVQRRILFSLFEIQDGRFHKAANVIGNTMKYHPHGDVAIQDALIHIAQKNFLIETQGNWGDSTSGDRAAAPRYIECKLSDFALDISFNKKTTLWTDSYDGRNKEPVHLPVKFPLLLLQGCDGIAVGLATKILPHNFIELIACSISILKKENFTLYPDFISGGSIDISEYKDGLSGGKIKIRSYIEYSKSKKCLIIKSIPYGTTSITLIESIINANQRNKIKIKRIENNSAQDIQIFVYLASGYEAEKTIQSLYSFTDCETSLSPNSCTIENESPVFLGVSEILKKNVQQIKLLLKQELEILQNELQEKYFDKYLEKIFIEEKIYRTIEECVTLEEIFSKIYQELEPFKKDLLKPIVDNDIEKLLEIRVKSISRYDRFKEETARNNILRYLKETQKKLKNLTAYTILYFEKIKKKYTKDRQRKSKITTFKTIDKSQFILSNTKVFYSSETGFVGTQVKSDQFVENCSMIDDILVITTDGILTVIKIKEKEYVGKNILYIDRWNSEKSKNLIFTIVFCEAPGYATYLKRFTVGGFTRYKNYSLFNSQSKSKIFYLNSHNSIKQAPNLLIKHKSKPRIKKELSISINDFQTKSRSSKGNIITKHTVQKIQISKGFIDS